MLELLHGKPELPQRPSHLWVIWLIRQCFPGAPNPGQRRAGASSQPLQDPRPGPSSGCLGMQVGETSPRSLVYVAGSHSSHKALLTMNGCQIVVVGGGDTNEGRLIQP